MHAGFGALRGACPMNIEASLPQIGALAWRDKPAVRADVSAHRDDVERPAGRAHKGPMLFGDFTIADAYFAPVCMRLRTYALPVPGHITAYIRRVLRPARREGLDRRRAGREGLPGFRGALPHGALTGARHAHSAD
jgi:glutathione S-transferase